MPTVKRTKLFLSNDGRSSLYILTIICVSGFREEKNCNSSQGFPEKYSHNFIIKFCGICKFEGDKNNYLITIAIYSRISRIDK